VIFANFNGTGTSTSSSGCPSIGSGVVTGGTATQGSYRNTSSGTSSTTRCFQCDYSNTPSSGTGGNGGVVDSSFATSGSMNSSSSYRFMYTEASSNPSTSFGFYIASNSVPSGKTVTIEFWYHMYGSNMGSLRCYGHQSSTYKATIFNVSGQQQASQGSSFLKASGTYTTNSSTTNYVSFYGTTGSGYRSDMIVDSVRMTYS
tara:strand:+ start:512 stop:1117 length:606 start_codon:yes stop_codon:yes gene_type:complete